MAAKLEKIRNQTWASIRLRQNPFDIRAAYCIRRVNPPFLELVAIVNEPLGAVISGFDLVSVIRNGLLGEVAA